LQAAIAVARYGSFTVAARELYVAQSTLSRQIASLERDLGVEVFHRHARSVELTELGRAFLAQIGDAVDAIETAKRAARSAAAETGVLTLDLTDDSAKAKPAAVRETT
jgi:DNA-binding transcriptional LysR family regulator